MPVQPPRLDLLGLTSAPGRRYISPHVRYGMTFYPQPDDPVFPSRSTKAKKIIWDAKSTHGALMSLTWNKVMGQISGRWEAIIKTPERYGLDIANGDILPDDWCDITCMRNGVVIPVCRGVVDSVRRVRASAGGATVMAWKLSGRDHGALWEFPIAYSNIWLQTIGELVAGLFHERVKGVIGGNPSKMFEVLINAAFGGGTQTSPWVLPLAFAGTGTGDGELLPLGDPSFLDELVIKNETTTRGAYYNEPALWAGNAGNAHQSILQWCNPLLNEFIYDLDIPDDGSPEGEANSRMAATIRERPFPTWEILLSDKASNKWFEDSLDALIASGEVDTSKPFYSEDPTYSPWFKLKRWDLPSWLMQDSDLGRSGVERINLIEVLANVGYGGAEQEQTVTCPPIWDRGSIERYGLRMMIKDTKFINVDKGSGQWDKDRRIIQKLLTDWYCLNPYFLSGSAIFKTALPEIRIGQRLRINYGKLAESETYYVEGVTLSYTVGPGPGDPPRSSTTFTLTRGFKGSDKQLLVAIDAMRKRYKDIH